MKLGFIGLGRMGSAMAANLLAAGHELTVYNRTKAKAEPLLKRGAHLAETLGDAARGEVVIAMHGGIGATYPSPSRKASGVRLSACVRASGRRGIGQAVHRAGGKT
jgi:nucleoside-diphosphate-sugar epimerase